jgi:hypothetical protein
MLSNPRMSMSGVDRTRTLASLISAAAARTAKNRQSLAVVQPITQKDLESSKDGLSGEEQIKGKGDLSALEVSVMKEMDSQMMENQNKMEIDSVSVKDSSVGSMKENKNNVIQESLEDHLRKQAVIAKDLLVEHLGFEPTEFVDDIINAVNLLIYQTLDAILIFVQDKMAETLGEGAEETAEECVENGMVAVETLLENAIDKCFDKFEVFVLNNVFKIPENIGITLPHYKVFFSRLFLSFFLSFILCFLHSVSLPFTNSNT